MAIELDFQEDYREAKISLWWKVPGRAMKIIPSRAFIPGSGDGERTVVMAKSKATDPKGGDAGGKAFDGAAGGGFSS